MSDPIKAITARIRCGCGPLACATLRHGKSAPWQSLLFDGGQHRIELSLVGEQVDAAIDAIRAAIDTEDFRIPGHLVTEIRLSGVERSADEALVRIEATTVAA